MSSSKYDEAFYEDDFEVESDDEECRKKPAAPPAAAGSVRNEWRDAGPAARSESMAASSAVMTKVAAPSSSVVAPAAIYSGAAPSETIRKSASAAVGDDRRSDAASWEAVDMALLRVGKQLGGGGFAVVFAATYGSKGPVAVKMIVDPEVSPSQTDEFMNELQVMALLQHPNIVRLVGANTLPPKQCFVMEMCGDSLFRVLHELSSKPISLHQRVLWAIDAAQAIGYLHTRRPSIIHRDVKSLNFLLAAGSGSRTGSPILKLCDFGLVGTRVTDAGTPAYMAPELFGNKPFSRAVDVYAFGILLWEMCARNIPFAGYRPLDIKDGVIAGTRPEMSKLPADVPDALQHLIQACWDGSPAKRPDINAVIESLTAVAAKLAASGVSKPPTRGAVTTSVAPAGDSIDALAARPVSRARPISASIYGRRPPT
jgi:serine/threonine protein kinase